MCQPKDKGGKRCLLHSAASKFIMRVVGIKTGASQAMIKDAIRELAREGKKGEAPSVDEVLQWLELRRFATEIDPDLDAHERKIQLNQIDKAKVEAVEQGVTASAWHAWKNLKKRVSLKMKSMKKAAVAIGLSGVLTLGLAGCVGGGGVTDNSPKPTSTSTSQPSDGPTSGEVATYGDLATATDSNGNPIVITDEYGSYQKVTINPNDDSLTVNPDTFDASVKTSAWTEEEISSGQKWVATFIAEQGIDSSAADGTSGWNSWKTNEASKYVAPEWSSLIDAQSTDGVADRAPFVINNPSNTYPILARDGGARVAGSDIKINTVYSTDSANYSSLVYEGVATVEYRATDASVLESLKAANPNAAEEDILKEYPNLADKVDGTFTSTLNFMYAVKKDDATGGWLITGFQNSLNSTFK